MDAFHHGVHAQHFETIPLRLDHRGIVANANEEPGGRRRQLLLDPGDQLAFREIGDGCIDREGRRLEAVGWGRGW